MNQTAVALLGCLVSWLLMLFRPGMLEAQETYHRNSDEMAYQQARTLYNVRAYASAYEAFEQFLQQRSEGSLAADASFKQALSALELYQDDGLALLRKHATAHPGYPGNRLIPFFAGKYHFRQGDYAKAVNALEVLEARGIPFDQYYEYHYIRGYSHLQRKAYSQATRWLKPLLQEPNDYEQPGRYFWAYASMAQGRTDTALAVFRSLESDPTYGDAVPVHIAGIHYRNRQYPETVSYGRKALERRGVAEKHRIRLLVGGAYFQQGQYIEAEPFLENAALPDSGFLYQKGITRLRMRKFQPAIEALAQLEVREDSLGQNITYHLGMAHLGLDEKLEAKNAFFFASLFDFNEALQASAAFNYAKLTYETGFVQEALSAFEDFLKQYPRSDDANEARKILGKLLLNSRNYADALQVVEDIPGRDRELNRIYQKLAFLNGKERFKNGDWEGAEDFLRRSLSQPVDPVINARVDFFMAETFYQTQRYQEALAYYRDFLFDGYADKTPYATDGYYGAAYCYYKVENYTKALSNFQLYLKSARLERNSPRYFDVQARMADCNFAMRNYAPAVQQYTEVIDNARREVDYALYQKGMIYGLQGKDDKQIATLKTLNQQFPQSPYLDDALYEIATLHFNAGDYGQAAREYQYIQQEFPNSPYARLALLQSGLIQYNERKDEQALATLKKVIRQYPNSREAKEAEVPLRNIYTERGQPDSLLAFLERSGVVKAGSGYRDSVTYEAAFSYLKRDQCEQGIQAFKDYLEKYPNGRFQLKSHYYLANCAIRTGDTAQALVNYEVVAAAGPNQYMPQALKKIALIYYRREAYPEARENFVRLEEVAQDNATQLFAQIGRMRSANRMGDCTNARELAKKVLDQQNATEQDQAEAHFVSGQCSQKAARFSEAIGQFDKVMELDDAALGAEAAYHKAECLLASNDLEATKKAVFALRDGYGNYSYWVVSGFILLSDIFAQQGNLFQAEQTLESVVANYEGQELRTRAMQKLEAIRAQRQSQEPSGQK